MKVFINKKEIEIFKGANVGNAVLAYSKRSYKLLCSGYLSVFDKYGNQTEADGPVQEGQKFWLKRNG